jgi:hypothetical protein
LICTLHTKINQIGRLMSKPSHVLVLPELQA